MFPVRPKCYISRHKTKKSENVTRNCCSDAWAHWNLREPRTIPTFLSSRCPTCVQTTLKSPTWVPGPHNMLKGRQSNRNSAAAAKVSHVSQPPPCLSLAPWVLAACAVLRVTGPSFRCLQGPLAGLRALPASLFHPYPLPVLDLGSQSSFRPRVQGSLTTECSFPWECHSALSRSQVLKYFSFSTQRTFLQVDYIYRYYAGNWKQ